MTILETTTDLQPNEVLQAARRFFALAGSSYAASFEQMGDGYLRLHLEVGEIVIGAFPQDGATRVRGCASRGVPLLSRFLTTLGPALDVRQSTRRYGHSRTIAAGVEHGDRHVSELGGSAETAASRIRAA